MLSEVAVRVRYTPEEYLALEEKAETKSEYYDGEIVAMTGASANHNRIAGNLYAMLNVSFETGVCEAFTSDMRLLIEQANTFTYPDVMVVCGEPEFAANRTDTIANPLLIVEVLSQSTEAYDRGRKFELYRTIPAFAHYLLVDQDRVHVEYFQKLVDGRWALTELDDPTEALSIEVLEFEISVSRIYSKVVWERVE